MEPTPNFAAGLAKARNELKAEGKLSERDDKLVSAILEKPVIVRPDGKKVRALYRIHLRVRSMYAKIKGEAQIRNIDWVALVAWIKEHWLEIIQAIITVVPFLI